LSGGELAKLAGGAMKAGIKAMAKIKSLPFILISFLFIGKQL
jgi:hypothetical protein